MLAARGGRSPGARRALSELCSDYWYPLYAFARRRGLDANEAQDAVQGFFAHLLEKQALDHVDPARGRFRSFLLASFRNHMADERARRTALKRGGGETPLPIDVGDAEERYAREPSHDLTPERIFARRWAVTVLERALERLRRDYADSGRETVFEALKPHLVGDRAAPPQADTARELGLNVITVRVAVHRLRRRYRQALIDEISQTLGSEEDLGSEIDHLFAALERPERPL